jgi:hypothetical protein
MKRSRVTAWAWGTLTLFAMLAPPLAFGDGGVIQLHEAQGPFLVTVFVSPEAAHGRLMDVSVLVQQRTNGEVILDAEVGLAVDPPNGLSTSASEPLCGLPPTGAGLQSPDLPQPQATVRATREQASNKLLYAAGLNLNAAGDWRLHVDVSRGPDHARFNCLVPVTRTSAKLSGLWPYLALPAIVITAFAMNQRLRRYSLEKGFESQSPTVCRA